MAQGHVRQWRSEGEIAALIEAYEGSGQSQREFSAGRGVPLSTLSGYLRRRWRGGRGARAADPAGRLIPVEVMGGGAGLVLVHGSGARIEVGPGFEAATLRRLLEALER